MYTIYDYIKYYKDKSIKEVNWNIMDNLICALLAYCPINENKLKTDLKSLNEELKKIDKNKSVLGLTALKVIEIIDSIYGSIRYKNIKISNFVSVKDNDVQFGALTIRLNNITVISFKGTDRSLIGWLENFRLSYQYPTKTQNMALDYLNNNITINDKNVYIVGHSKGGNLAMYSAMNTKKSNFNRISKVINLDGPGFLKKEFKSLKYDLLKQKLINIVPENSLVGILMYNKNYIVVKSKDIGYSSHYPNTWEVFGECFVEGKLSKISRELHQKSTAELDKLDMKMLEEATETIFKTIGQEYRNNFKIDFKKIETIYHNMSNIDPNVKKYIDTIFNALMRPSFEHSTNLNNK